LTKGSGCLPTPGPSHQSAFLPILAMTLWGTVTTLQTLPSLGSQPIDLMVDMDVPGPESTGAGNLSEGICSLYQKCQFYDVMLVVGGKRFPAHQAVLASLSSAMRERLRQAPEKPAVCTGEAASPGRPAAQPPEARSPASATSPRKVNSPAASPGAGGGYPEVHFEDVTNTEAVTVLLDFVYGLGTEYRVSSDEVNKDVLRLAQILELPRLRDLASSRLAKGLTSDNAIERMATCEEFELKALYDLIAEQVTKSGEALTRVSTNSEVTKHPKILQNLLIRSASLYAADVEPSKKRGASSPWPAEKKARTPQR